MRNETVKKIDYINSPANYFKYICASKLMKKIKTKK